MFGMPRDANHASKLALMLRHLTFDQETAAPRLLEDVCAALLDHLARRARLGLPVRVIRGSPLLEPALRDAAFVLGAVWDMPRMRRFLRDDAMAAYGERTVDWLRPVLETHGLRWPWPEADQRQVA
jgi:hypothetical protein